MRTSRFALGSLLALAQLVFQPLATAAPGDIRWQLATGAPIRSAPLLAGDVLVVGNFAGSLQGLNWPSRTPRWKVALKGSLSSQPALDGERIYVQTSRQLYALAVADGRILWQRDLGDQGDWSGLQIWDSYQGSPLLAGDLLLVAMGRTLHALSRADGTPRWQYQSSDRIMATPTISGERILLADNAGQLSALSLPGGKLLWQQTPSRNAIQSRIAVWQQGAQQLGIYGSRDAAVHAFDLNTGKPRWQRSHDTSWVVGSPLVRGDAVYIGTSDGLFFQALDAATGKERWRIDTGQNAFTAPLVDDGKLLLTTGDAYHPGQPGKVSAVALDGQLRWQKALPSGLFGQPIVLGDTLIVGTEDGKLYGVALR
ncbi:Outer membrane protein assembly factor BamB, contains PQQ-like beta-propeller repeat [Andreprevotia lacus DSM 23236]|uniref:Outer membrane protein assembly factor BamB, contains PQQ-like beta-propeller repeat n=1 Tax=Andreprevotia lacus DSM 23236 TaxID=1121001 RepID=A0A1W1XQ24_9NEIS|nr:PQQ-binding-like beta-propeller repeat protein [Andreprevotia lacus]SMC26100.1 Outer membrane protein assembly factor BamB, contains PQQ-like beta-propeller repeat [Andreprevotia lacus DSM 23236]